MFSRFSNVKMFSWFKKELSERQTQINQKADLKSPLYDLECIISWQNPLHSLFVLALINIFFGLVKIYNLTFYTVLSSAALIVCLYDVWNTKLWPNLRSGYRKFIGDGRVCQSIADNSRCLTPEQIDEFIRNAQMKLEILYVKMQDLRSNHKFLFSTILAVLSFKMLMIGKTVSMFWLAYITIVTPLVMPIVYVRLVPDSAKCFIRKIVDTFKFVITEANNPNICDEFLPEMTDETMNQLNEVYNWLWDEKSDTELAIEESLLLKNKTSEKFDDSSTTSSVSSGLSFLKLSSPPPKKMLSTDLSQQQQQSSRILSSSIENDAVTSTSTATGTLFDTLSTIIVDSVQAIGSNLKSYSSTKDQSIVAKSQTSRPPSNHIVESLTDNEDFEIIDAECLENEKY